MKDSRQYYFYMPAGAPYQDAIEAAGLVAQDIQELHKQALEKQKERARGSSRRQKRRVIKRRVVWPQKIALHLLS